MKHFFLRSINPLVAFALFATLTATVRAKPGPGQQNPPCGGNMCPTKGKGCGTVGANPINPAKANAFREVIDLQTFGPAPIAWGRSINSREYQYNSKAHWEFGFYGTSTTDVQWESSWHNNWTFEMFNKSGSSTVLTVRYPNGNDYDFKYLVSSPAPVGAQFLPTAENGDRIYKTASSPDKFVLRTPEGEEYYFERWTGSGHYLRLVQKRNGLGFYWGITYDDLHNEPQRIKRITNNFGQWIEIERDTGPDGQLRIKRVYPGYGATPDYTRQVTYNYSNYAMNNGTHSFLTSVDYPGGEHAVYSYTPIHQYSGSGNGPYRPVLEKATDPMYRGAGASVSYVYNRSETDGSIKEEHNRDPQNPSATGELIVSIKDGGGTDPEVHEGDGTLLPREFHNDTGVLSAEVDGEGRRTEYDRNGDGGGFIIEKREPNGAHTDYLPDWAGRVKTQTDTFGKTQKNEFNDYGFQTRHEDEMVNVTEWHRNATPIGDFPNGPLFPNSRLTQINYPDLTYESWSNFDWASQAQTHRLRNGGTEYFTYDSLGNIHTKVDAEGNLTTYEYYSDLTAPTGLLKKVTDANLHETTFDYSWRGQITQITYPATSPDVIPIVTYEYDDFGNRTAMVDEMQHRTEWAYDSYNRLKTVKDPLARTTNYEYGHAPGCSCSYVSTISRIISPGGRVTNSSYDHADRITCKTEGAGTTDAATTTWDYYDLPQEKTERTDPRGKKWEEIFDGKHRKLSSEDPNHNITQWTYWDNDLKKTEVRPGSAPNTTQFFYDEQNRLKKTIDPLTRPTEMTYTGGDKIKTIKDANSHTYTFEYDYLNREKSLKYPDDSIEAFDYDFVGNLTTYTTRAGQERTSIFDNRNRETHFEWSDDTPAVDKTYDDAGRVLTIINSVSALSYSYDDAGQLTSETEQILPDGNPMSVEYYYNDDGQRQLVYEFSGGAVTYWYTGRGQVKEIADGWFTGAHPSNPTSGVNYVYDLNGNRAQRNVLGGVQSSYSYDFANRLEYIDHSGLARFDYGYDARNNRTSRKATIGSQQTADVYGPDSTDQITNVKYNFNAANNTQSRLVNYVYDAVGNRTNLTDNGTSTGYTPNDLNQYTAVGSDSPENDDNGNLAATGDWTYGYDAQNRLTIASGATIQYTFTYDGRNRCVTRQKWERSPHQAWTLTNTTNHYYDGWNVIEDQDPGNNLKARYIHGAQVDELFKSSSPDNGDIYYHQDALGSVVALTNSSGAVVERCTYDIYGSPAFFDSNSQPVNDSTVQNRFLFTGREYLPELRLYDYRNRIYSPELGRFLQIDPIRFSAKDVNLYRYVSNRVVSDFDPSGQIGRRHEAMDFPPEPPQASWGGLYSCTVADTSTCPCKYTCSLTQCRFGPCPDPYPYQNASAEHSDPCTDFTLGTDSNGQNKHESGY